MNLRKHSWVLILLLVMTNLCPLHAAGPSDWPVVTGLVTHQNPSAEEDLVNSIEVTLEEPATLYLQYRDMETKEWITAETYPLTGSGQPETVNLVFPEIWKQRTDSTWRIMIPETSRTKAFQARILVTARNRG